MKKTLYYAAVIIVALIFAVSAFFLIRYYVQSRQAQNTYEDLSHMVSMAQAELPQQQTELGPAMAEVTDPETGEVKTVLAEYAPIYQLNPDTVGWIRIEGMEIDFPVLYHPQVQDYYLYRDFYGDSSSHGAVYIREACDPFTPSDNVVIYGHRMRDGSMFSPLLQYTEKSFWESHRYIRFDALDQYRTYEILAVFTIDSTLDSDFLYHEFVNAEDPAEFDTFIAQCEKYALYETDVDAQYGDKLITLSTCYGQIGGVTRLVVVAKQISE